MSRNTNRPSGRSTISSGIGFGVRSTLSPSSPDSRNRLRGKATSRGRMGSSGSRSNRRGFPGHGRF